MSELKTGTIVHLANWQTVKVTKLLGESGQGYVYLVNMSGKEMALKWYKKDPSTNSGAFYKNLCLNALNVASSPVFIWSKYMTRNDEQFRISLVDKYYPGFRGKITNAYVGGNIEDA